MTSLEDMPNYSVWVEFYNNHSHLTNRAIAARAVSIWGGALGTWRDRFKTIATNQAFKEKIGKRKQYDDENHKKFFDYINIEYPIKHSPPEYSKTIDENKIICVSDPHEPYGNNNVWEHILENHHNAGHLHINGDMADFYSKSHFVAFSHENFDMELRSVWNRMEWLSQHFRKVTMIKGNHDDRVEKKIAACVQSDLLILTQQDLIGYMASFFDNIEVVGMHIKDERTREDVNIGFIWQYKDIVFTHIERSQKQVSALMGGIHESLLAWSGTIQLKPYRVIVQAHNHQSDHHVSGGVLQILAPMAARITGTGLGYVFKPTLRGVPPQVGYTIIHNENGKTDFNKTQNWLLNQ
jgi:predicted phosphodiesterase